MICFNANCDYGSDQLKPCITLNTNIYYIVCIYIFPGAHYEDVSNDAGNLLYMIDQLSLAFSSRLVYAGWGMFTFINTLCICVCVEII